MRNVAFLLLLLILAGCSGPSSREISHSVNNRLTALEEAVRTNDTALIAPHILFRDGVHAWRVFWEDGNQDSLRFGSLDDLMSWVRNELGATELVFVERNFRRYDLEAVLSGAFIVKDEHGQERWGNYMAFFLRHHGWRMSHLRLDFR